MKKEEFISAFMEGAAHAPQDITLKSLVGVVFDLRKKLSEHKEHIEYMDEIARSNTISLNCRSCDNSYEPDCELSEMSHEGNYCGRNEWCTP